ncbi:hypothetical protein [Halobacteriovorax sp. JY17]|uniref:hypothetical protein n=1 Tax=Halobacteriovorax sp. JY17 TaxID=2014617 RepID=UPI000C55D9E0|nr:hypothetical protein [Halobacteriovorax sp. JY17]PIK15733.1 MAG: hypothetical protein CES88_03115 [Halobacteriovorax sp. JY17]
MSLFKLPDSKDRIYNHVKVSKYKEDIREYLNSLWKSYQPFCPDQHFKEEFSHDLIARWWEMYLGNVFLTNKHKIVIRKGAGPDFKISFNEKTFNIEAITPNSGEGDDACPVYPRKSAFSYSDIKLILRLTHAIWEKNKKFEQYLENGLVKEGDTNIIAVNLSKIDLADEIYSETDIPIIAKAFLGFDDLKIQVPINLGSGESGESKPVYDAREKLIKVNGADVSLTSFVDGSYPLISGIFCSAESFVGMPESGKGIWTLSNPTSSNPVMKNHFKFGTEWLASLQANKVSLDKVDHSLEN